MSKKEYLSKIIMSTILVFITTMTTIFTSSIPAHASDLDMSEGAGYS